MVTRREVNLTIGYFALTSHRRQHMSSSYIYFTSNLVWMIPRGAEISSLEKLLKPFDSLVWVFFVLTLAAAFIAIGVIKLSSKSLQNFVVGENVRDANLNIVNISFGGSINKVPSGNFARFILMTFMIYCFVITNSYKGGLLNFMRMTVREPEVTSTEEMIAKDFKFYMLVSSTAYLTEMPQVAKRSVFTSLQEFNRMLDKVIVPGFKGAILTSVDHLAYRNIHAFPDRYYNHAPDVIFANNLVIYLNKDSCLTYQFDEIIENLISGGLIETWASNFIDKNFLKHRSSNSAKTLNFSQLLGAFQLLLTGIIMSSIVFLVEFIHERVKTRVLQRFLTENNFIN